MADAKAVNTVTAPTLEQQVADMQATIDALKKEIARLKQILHVK